MHSVMKYYMKETRKIDNVYQSVSKNSSEPLDISRHSLDHMTKQRTSLEILQTGLLLLHIMSQHDSGFINRHVTVQHQYVQLICGLTHIYKHKPGNNDSECKYKNIKFCLYTTRRKFLHTFLLQNTR